MPTEAIPVPVGTANPSLFCSQSCPGEVILKAQDWANARRPVSAPVVGGFHTPVERDVLRILLRGQASKAKSGRHVYRLRYLLVFGAELNSKLEHQTHRVTTKGSEKPLCSRRAWSADHVA